MAYCEEYGVYRCTSTALSCLLLLDGSILDRDDPARRGTSCVCHSLDTSRHPNRRQHSCCLSLSDVRGDGSRRDALRDEMLLLPYRRHEGGFLCVCLPPAAPARHTRRAGLVPACRAAGHTCRPNARMPPLRLPGTLAQTLCDLPYPPAAPATLPVIADFLFIMQS